MTHTIEISKSLWIQVDVVHPDYDDGLFYLRDDTGGNTLIDRAEIPALIEALNKVKDITWNADSSQKST